MVDGACAPAACTHTLKPAVYANGLKLCWKLVEFTRGRGCPALCGEKPHTYLSCDLRHIDMRRRIIGPDIRPPCTASPSCMHWLNDNPQATKLEGARVAVGL